MTTEEPANQYDRRKAETKRRLREAMERLRSGNPTSDAVTARKWKLDVKSVAQEAGISRNAIYQNHPEIVEELRAARREGAKGRAEAENNEGRHLKRLLEEAAREQKLLARENAELLARALHAEKQLKELRKHRRGLEMG